MHCSCMCNENEIILLSKNLYRMCNICRTITFVKMTKNYRTIIVSKKRTIKHANFVKRAVYMFV